jgi:hypothetical protein
MAELANPGSVAQSMRLMGYPEAEIHRITNSRTDTNRIELVARVVADFDALDTRRKRAVNVRELMEQLREAIR